MNYLAHVFLAGPCPDAIAGALLGDFVKGTQAAERYPAPIREAIALHRAVDRYTDRHPIVFASRRLVSPARRRFAGIMVDVFYDHFLARDWPRYSSEALPTFTARVYTALAQHGPTAPERLQRMLPRMRADDWLASYADVEAIDAAIDGISRRFKRTNNLAGGAEELLRHYDTFDEYFSAFFPQLLRHVAALTCSIDQPIASESFAA